MTPIIFHAFLKKWSVILPLITNQLYNVKKVVNYGDKRYEKL